MTVHSRVCEHVARRLVTVWLGSSMWPKHNAQVGVRVFGPHAVHSVACEPNVAEASCTMGFEHLARTQCTVSLGSTMWPKNDAQCGLRASSIALRPQGATLTLYYKVRLCTTRCDFVLQGATLHYKERLCTTRCDFVLQGTTLYNKVRLCTTRKTLINPDRNEAPSYRMRQ